MYNLQHVQTANGINFLSLSVAVAPFNDAKFNFFFIKFPKIALHLVKWCFYYYLYLYWYAQVLHQWRYLKTDRWGLNIFLNGFIFSIRDLGCKRCTTYYKVIFIIRVGQYRKLFYLKTFILIFKIFNFLNFNIYNDFFQHLSIITQIEKHIFWYILSNLKPPLVLDNIKYECQQNTSDKLLRKFTLRIELILATHKIIQSTDRLILLIIIYFKINDMLFCIAKHF